MERWQVKVLTVFGCFFIPFICTLLPVRLDKYFEKKGERGKRILSYLMCFGGGVFFATFMLHMAPESRSIVEFSLTEPNGIEYPLADLFMALGFFLVLVCEKLVLKVNAKRKESSRDAAKCVQFVNNKDCFNSDVNSGKITGPNHGKASKYQNQMVDIEDLADPNCPLYGSGSCCKDPEEVTIQANASEETGFIPEGINSNGHVQHEAHLHEEALLEDAHSTRSLILLTALSFHRIFEGMSVGLQHTTTNVINLFIAVMCHETIIGFSLGLQFVKHKWSTRRIVIACVLCSLIMPVGVIVGTLMVELGSTSNTIDVVNGILQSFATGTFIYVTFFEILQDELCTESTSLLKVFYVFLGFAAMAVLCAIPEEDPEILTGHDTEATTMMAITNSSVLASSTTGY